ncbi:MAG: hypothetical protein JO246_02810 [Frankiaceae bacterium]|nr:hypothetical protein [Frankiaceae bacterium]MBV9870678.1 hypothetical protein [Frankiaceae bacterium]
MRKQYHFRPGPIGLDAWDVGRLVELAADSPVEDLPLTSIGELDAAFWYDHGYEPTVRSVVEHARLMAAVDLQHPIVVDPDGLVMDGMHRVGRSLLDGHDTVKARRLAELPAPDFTNCRPDELPYD